MSKTDYLNQVCWTRIQLALNFRTTWDTSEIIKSRLIVFDFTATKFALITLMKRIDWKSMSHRPVIDFKVTSLYCSPNYFRIIFTKFRLYEWLHFKVELAFIYSSYGVCFFKLNIRLEINYKIDWPEVNGQRMNYLIWHFYTQFFISAG